MTGSEGHTIGVRHARSRRGRSKGRYRLSDSSILVLPPSGAAGGRQILVRDVATGREIDESFASLSRDKADALFVAPGSFFNTQRVQLAVLAARYALPGVYAVRAYTEAGGLMSYGTDILDAFRQVGAYTARILKGAKPADLPVLQSTKFELVLNLNTAQALGLTFSPNLLALADEVIE